MFKIGDFAKLSRVSVKTLHHYEQVGLLKPASIDRFTSYRYYSIEQLARLNRILALKDLGFSLGQIGRLLDDRVTAEQLEGMLKLRMSELQEQITADQERLGRVAARLQLIREEGKMSKNEVILKPIGRLKIVSAREVVPEQLQMREHCIALMDEVCAALRQAGIEGAETCLALYYEAPGEGIDVEMAMIVPEEAALPFRQGRVKFYELPSIPTMASIIYQGRYDDFAAVAAVYADLGRWIEANHYRIIGPSRELYLRAPQSGTGDPVGMMEIQFPVEKS